MELSQKADGRLVRAVLVAALTVVAVRSLRRGKRLSGALAGAGAAALGYQARSGSRDMTEIEIPDVVPIGGDEGAPADSELRCAACGEPIRPGQGRGPNENDEIVHDTCPGR